MKIIYNIFFIVFMIIAIYFMYMKNENQAIMQLIFAVFMQLYIIKYDINNK